MSRSRSSHLWLPQNEKCASKDQAYSTALLDCYTCEKTEVVSESGAKIAQHGFGCVVCPFSHGHTGRACECPQGWLENYAATGKRNCTQCPSGLVATFDKRSCMKCSGGTVARTLHRPARHARASACVVRPLCAPGMPVTCSWRMWAHDQWAHDQCAQAFRRAHVHMRMHIHIYALSLTHTHARTRARASRAHAHMHLHAHAHCNGVCLSWVRPARVSICCPVATLALRLASPRRIDPGFVALNVPPPRSDNVWYSGENGETYNQRAAPLPPPLYAWES